MRYKGLLVALLLIPAVVFGQQRGDYRLSVLTCSTADELYTTFGHTAIRIANDSTGYDKVFNYGMFNFRTPNFYMKFMNGELDYYLGIDRSDQFIWDYTVDGREVVEQVIELPQDQIVVLATMMETQSLPENRYYRYRFIDRNCTTEVRNLLMPYIANRELYEMGTGRTYRGFLDRCLVRKPWTRTGINLILGSVIDREATVFGSMFLPQMLFDGLAEAVGADGRPLVSETRPLNDVTLRDGEPGIIKRNIPSLIIAAICLLVLLARNRVVNGAFLTALALLGCLITFLTLFGGHPEFEANFNIIWANPIWILVCILRGKLRRGFYWFMLLCCAAMYVIWICGVQYCEPPFLLATLTVAWIAVSQLRTHSTTGIPQETQMR